MPTVPKLSVLFPIDGFLTLKKEIQKVPWPPAAKWSHKKVKTREQVYYPFFGKYFENIYYKNINVSTTNHFTLVDKAIYNWTRKLSHKHTGQSQERNEGSDTGCMTVLLSQMSQVYKVRPKNQNTDKHWHIIYCMLKKNKNIIVLYNVNK